MDPRSRRNRPARAGLASLLGVVVLGAGASAGHAQPRRAGAARPIVLSIARGRPGGPSERAATFRVHAERAAREHGYRLVDATTFATDRAIALGSVPRSRVEVFRRIEELLMRARMQVAALREGEALASLAQAERLAEDHADVPGSAAWSAEVQTAIGITAAQAGLTGLMETAFARAATLDPSRGVRAAEAPPQVADRAAAIALGVATRPVGSFELAVDVPGAVVFLDDREIGPAPQIVRGPVGRHAVRVEAPGRRAWGRLIDMHEGRRPAMRIHLSPDPLLVVAARLGEAGEQGDLFQLAAFSRALGLSGAWLLEVGGGERDRALLSACTAEGCAPPQRLEIDEVPIVLRHRGPRPDAQLALALDTGRAWLTEPAPVVVPPPPPIPPWERWYVWVATAAALAAASGISAALLQPAPDERRVVVVGCGELCP